MRLHSSVDLTGNVNMIEKLDLGGTGTSARRANLCAIKSRHATSCHVMPRHVPFCHTMSRHVTSCHVTSCTSCHVMSRHVTYCHVMPRCVTSCHVTSCHVGSRHVTSCHVMSRPVTSCHVGCPEGCRFHTASVVYYLVFIGTRVRSTAVADYVLLLFNYFIFLFTVRSQKLLDRFSPNFQELCILV